MSGNDPREIVLGKLTLRQIIVRGTLAARPSAIALSPDEVARLPRAEFYTVPADTDTGASTSSRVASPSMLPDGFSAVDRTIRKRTQQIQKGPQLQEVTTLYRHESDANLRFTLVQANLDALVASSAFLETLNNVSIVAVSGRPAAAVWQGTGPMLVEPPAVTPVVELLWEDSTSLFRLVGPSLIIQDLIRVAESLQAIAA